MLARNISFTRNIRWFRLLHDAYSDASHVPKQESTREKLTAGKRPRNDRSTSFLFHGGRALLIFFHPFCFLVLLCDIHLYFWQWHGLMSCIGNITSFYLMRRVSSRWVLVLFLFLRSIPFFTDRNRRFMRQKVHGDGEDHDAVRSCVRDCWFESLVKLVKSFKY